MVLERWGLVKLPKNQFIDEKSQESASTIITTWFDSNVRTRPLGPHYTLKTSENKARTPIFDVESIFDGFKTIGTRKMG